jgi:hypothetical protein
MIGPQRQRELAMQVTRFLDGAPEFPSRLTDEEMRFVDRFVAIQEMLLASGQLTGTSIDAVRRGLACAANRSAQNSADGPGQSPSTGDHERNPIPQPPSTEESTDTCRDGGETVDEPRSE